MTAERSRARANALTETHEPVKVADSKSRGRTLCLGEAIVDLICDRPVRRLRDVKAFVPHCGGAAANVAVAAARRGAQVSLMGGVGQDDWGRWIRARLEAERVDLTWFASVPAAQTPLACVTVDEEGEPSYIIYGAGIGPAMAAVADHLEHAIRRCDALFIGSNTLVGRVERSVTDRARSTALAHRRPVLLDVNLRLARWPSVEVAAATVRSSLCGALLARMNAEEACVLTGRADPEEAARALLAEGVRCAVITLGRDGAIVRGEVNVSHPGLGAHVVSTVGAGDAFMGTLIAVIAHAQYELSALKVALPLAVAAGAEATERWGALESRAGEHAS